MKLFPDEFDASLNLLPCDGEVFYFGSVFNEIEGREYFDKLLSEVNWVNDESILFGKRFLTKRKMALFSDRNQTYRYSGKEHFSDAWSETLLEIKKKVEQYTNEKYNACLLNLYHSGEEGMGLHQDSESELKRFGSIASVSFGAERKFVFKHLTLAEKIEVWLENGSLLEMKGKTQHFWKHGLPKSKKITVPRINLTFRQMIDK